jgi:hypothetical protein
VPGPERKGRCGCAPLPLCDRARGRQAIRADSRPSGRSTEPARHSTRSSGVSPIGRSRLPGHGKLGRLGRPASSAPRFAGWPLGVQCGKGRHSVGRPVRSGTRTGRCLVPISSRNPAGPFGGPADTDACPVWIRGGGAAPAVRSEDRAWT